jgi:molybdopterin molybdotransferase
MITYPEALQIMAGAVSPLDGSPMGLLSANRSVAAADVSSRIAVPGFANSAMDGFALRAADSTGASDAAPLDLPVVGLAAAGDPPTEPMAPGGAVEIMTGAPVPAGCDTVVPVERVEKILAEDGQILAIRLRQTAEKGRHIRRAGEDFQADVPVLKNGDLVQPHGIMALAATGNDQLTARPIPRLAVVTTGSELTAAGVPSREGLIRDANGPYLAAFIQHIGATLTSHQKVPDSKIELEKAIAQSSEQAHIVLTTGGVSAGRFDHVPQTVVEAGGEVLFHKVGIKPGKPILFARLKNGSLLFGLPGNPVAVAVGLRFFVLPAIRMLQGLAPEHFHSARNTVSIHKHPNLRFFAKARATVNDDGQIEVTVLPGQESFRIGPLLESNCWAIAPEGTECVSAGDPIQIAPLYPTHFLQ